MYKILDKQEINIIFFQVHPCEGSICFTCLCFLFSVSPIPRFTSSFKFGACSLGLFTASCSCLFFTLYLINKVRVKMPVCLLPVAYYLPYTYIPLIYLSYY